MHILFILTIFRRSPLEPIHAESCFLFVLFSRILSALVDGLLLKSSGLQDSTQYSGRSQLWCSLDGFDSSSDFTIIHSSFKDFGYRSNIIINIVVVVVVVIINLSIATQPLPMRMLTTPSVDEMLLLKYINRSADLGG